MKKLKLRGWVKVTLFILLVCTLLSNQYSNAIDDCVNNGNEYEMCSNELR